MPIPSSPETRLRLMTGLFLTRGDEVLLLYKTSGRVVKEVWCPAAGGHVEPEELKDPLTCVLRELKEETGLTTDFLTGLSLRYLTVRAGDGELRQNFYYFASPDPDRFPDDGVLTSSEGVLRWFRAEELTDLPMPHSARAVLDHWLREGRRTDSLYGGIAVPEGVRFTELTRF